MVRWLFRRPTGAHFGFWILILSVGTLVVVPLALLLLNSFRDVSFENVGFSLSDLTIQNYIEAYSNPKTYIMLLNSLWFAIGSALPLEEELSMEVQGRDQVAGLPKTITITSSEVTEAIVEPLAAIINVVRSVLERTPPELSSDIIDRGIAVLGGGALLRNIDRLLTQETGVPCYVAEDPISRVAAGAGMALDNIHILRQSLPSP